MATSSRTVGSLTITVEETCLGDDKQIKIELDDDLNDGETCFEPNQDIHLRVYLGPQDLSITVETTNGTVYATGSGGLSEHEDEIVITDGEGSTSYPIDTVTSMEWLGNEPCPIDTVEYAQGRNYLRCNSCSGSPDGGDACKVTYGVIRIVYKALYVGYILSVPEAGKVVVYAYENI
jgi:hypothetical protein